MVGTFRTHTPSTTPTYARRRVKSHHTSYANRRWRDLCEAWLQQYPICVLCACQRRYNDGVIANHIKTQRNLVVDHIQPHRDDMDLFWDMDNLETLCRMPCHDRIKQSHEKSNRSVADWMTFLRSEIELHQSRLHIESLARWIPDHITGQLL